MKKSFAIQKTFVVLHPTNKQNDKMKNVLKIEILTALAMFMGALMLAGLFLCNIYLIAISEALALVIIGLRFFLTSKNK